MSYASATAALQNTAQGFKAYLDALDNPPALEVLGFKRMKETRLFDDVNAAFLYPGGTSMADAMVTHSFVFDSAFPDHETELFFVWGCVARLDSNDDDNYARGHGGVTLSDGTLLTNQGYLGIELSGTTEGYIDGVLTASGKYVKPAGAETVTLQQRCYMDKGFVGSASIMSVDSADILIREYVK